MPSHQETQHLPFTTKQIFDLVADVERYPEFLPWCVAARVLSREENAFTAELLIGYKNLRERYTSLVTLSRPSEPHGACAISVSLLHGPFHHLMNQWQFIPEGEGTRVEFFLDFSFRTMLLEKLIGAFFHKATQKMVESFTARAHILYGQPPA